MSARRRAAARFAGFSRAGIVLVHLPAVGRARRACRHLRGGGTVGQLQPTISPGYGFTAIIVAFLGRLNPVGVLIAGLVLALSYLGGEAAQVALGVSDKVTRVFQGILLFYILACDTLILYRIALAACRGCASGAGWSTAWRTLILTIITAATPLLIAAIGELVVERPASSISASRA